MEINRKRVARRLASGLVAGALVLGGLAISGGSVSAKTPSSPTTQRLSGDDRYETSVAIARSAQYSSANNLVIASGEKPYDALAAAALAGAKNAPILLVKANSIPESVADYLSDNFDIDGTVYIVGGTSVISDDVLEAVEDALEDATVKRVAGDNRYKTAYEIADEVGVMDSNDTLIIVNGDDDRWADALSAGPLSSSKGWPIVTTANGGLNDDAKAFIDAYLGQAGVGTGKFLLVGGPAVLPTSIEEYLVGEGVEPSDIRRVFGADRYQTNFLVNIYMLDTLAFGGLTTAYVSLASGTSPWDALAGAAWAGEKSSHIALVPGATLGSNAQTLAGALSASGVPMELWILGGKAVVSDTAKLTFIATSQSADVGAPTLSGCAVGSRSITMTFPKRISWAASQAITTSATNGDVYEINGGAITTGITVDVSANVLNPDRTVYDISLTDPLEEDDVFEFLGVAEAVPTNGYSTSESYAGATCTVAEDVTRPTFSFTAVTGSALNMSTLNSAFGIATSPAFVLTSSEPLDGTALVSAGALTWTSGTAKSATLAATPLNSSATSWLLAVTASAEAPALDALVTISGLAVKDRAGLTSEVSKNAEVSDELVAPTASVVAQRCVNTGTANSADLGFTVSAKSASSTTNTGPSFNSWRVIVKSQRGLLLPTVAADTTAKTITVTADANYHDGNDIVTAAANAGLTGALGGWTFADGATALVETTAAGVPLSGGIMTCYLAIAGSEPFTVTDTNIALNVDGVSQGTAGRLSGANTAVLGGSILVQVTGITRSGTATIQITGMQDAARNTAPAFTVTATL